jgi:uncharacterized protein YraI
MDQAMCDSEEYAVRGWRSTVYILSSQANDLAKSKSLSQTTISLTSVFLLHVKITVTRLGTDAA